MAAHSLAPAFSLVYWLALPRPSGDSPLADREHVRRARLVALMAVVGLTVNLGFGLVVFGPEGDLGFPRAWWFVTAVNIAALLVNRSGRVTLGALLALLAPIGGTTLLLWISRLAHRPEVALFYPTYAPAIVAAAFLLGRRAALVVGMLASALILAHVLQNQAMYVRGDRDAASTVIFLVVNMWGLYGGIAVASWVGAGSMERAIKEADRTAEVEALCGKLEAANKELINANERQARLMAEVQQLYEDQSAAARTDALTGLLNHTALHERLHQEIAQAKRHGRQLSLLFFDIDHFKAINDAFGHQTGNRVLSTVAERCRQALRVGATVGRYGGEEFVALLPDTGANAALGLAERLRQEICRSPVAVEAAGSEGAERRRETFTSVSASIGVATLDADGETVDELITAADQAMYAAKQAGRNRVAAARATRILAAV